MRTRFRPSPAIVVACLALVCALGGSAYAVSSFIGSDGQIHGCVTGTGQLVLVKPGAKCKKGEGQAIAWNQKGPRGLRGPQGLRGFTGAPGPGAVRFSLTHADDGGTAHTFLTLDELTVKLVCGSTYPLALEWDSTLAATLSYEWIDTRPSTNPPTIEPAQGSMSIAANTPPGAPFFLGGAPGQARSVDGQFIYSNANRVITLALHAEYSSASNPAVCSVNGSATPTG